MTNRQIHRSATRRGIVLFIAAALVLGLGATGIQAVLARGSRLAADDIRPARDVLPDHAGLGRIHIPGSTHA